MSVLENELIQYEKDVQRYRATAGDAPNIFVSPLDAVDLLNEKNKQLAEFRAELEEKAKWEDYHIEEIRRLTAALDELKLLCGRVQELDFNEAYSRWQDERIEETP